MTNRKVGLGLRQAAEVLSPDQLKFNGVLSFLTNREALFSVDLKVTENFYAFILEAMSLQYQNVMFANVDVDEAQELVESSHIKVLPTFQFFKKVDKEDFQAALKSAGEKLVVVDFSATWCGPCKMIKPFYHSLCEKYGNVVFLEVDVDDCQDVASECEVKCMPTFQFYKKGQKVGEFSGANKEKLEDTINKLS
ncbi:thioredoxin [Echinops telfairi]|uniref:Thioredoxin n=1 Tax=Echinops telfairi TaxID=9371 RepID=A0AC55DL45_ECHTE|nr:thioredoxin [Echinops telfairi]